MGDFGFGHGRGEETIASPEADRSNAQWAEVARPGLVQFDTLGGGVTRSRRVEAVARNWE